MHGVPVGAAGPLLRGVQVRCMSPRSSAFNMSHRGIRLVSIQSKTLDHDAGGSGAVGQWPPLKAPQRPASAYVPPLLLTPPKAVT